MIDLNLVRKERGFVGPTFTVADRLKRALWYVAWLLTARWSPPPCHRWRILILRTFGAKVSWRAYVYPDVDVWAPWNLKIDDYGTLGRGVTCYNIAPISIGAQAIVSQGAYLCTGTHDFRDPAFPLIARPIRIEPRVWICARAFVGPGVTVGEGAVLAATGAAFKDLEPWMIYVGNPAVAGRVRQLRSV